MLQRDSLSEYLIINVIKDTNDSFPDYFNQACFIMVSLNLWNRGESNCFYSSSIFFFISLSCLGSRSIRPSGLDARGRQRVQRDRLVPIRCVVEKWEFGLETQRVGRLSFLDISKIRT